MEVSGEKREMGEEAGKDRAMKRLKVALESMEVENIPDILTLTGQAKGVCVCVVLVLVLVVGFVFLFMKLMKCFLWEWSR